jgi:2-methylcitrate dehydratase PrpD
VRTLFDFCACVVAGGEVEWPRDPAARLAVSAHLRDQDDLHLGSLTHPGGVVWSAVVACAAERGSTVGDSMAAAALGYEVMIRLAEAAGPEHRQRWHVTVTAGTGGAAAAAARLLGGDEVDAVAQAASVAGGSSHAMIERTGTRFLHRAHATGTGVVCARAAGAGLPASRGVLGSGRGAFAELPGDPTAARAAPGVEETGFRLYGATGFAHAAIDAALSLGPLDPATLERVRVTVSPPAAVALASNPDPADNEEAWWSIQHAIAVCLATGDPQALAAGRAGGALFDLCRRVEVDGGGSGWEANVEVSRADGSTSSAAVEGPRGHGQRAASDDDLLAKWQRVTGRDGSAFFARLLEAGDADPLAPLLEDQLGPLLP